MAPRKTTANKSNAKRGGKKVVATVCQTPLALQDQGNVSDTVVDESLLGQKVKRIRRGTDLMCERVIERKFAHYDVRVLETATGKATHKIVRQSVEDVLHEHRSTNKYLTSRFWVDFNQEFGLSSAMFANVQSLGNKLEIDPNDCVVRAELLEALVPVHYENPTFSRVDDVICVLDFVSKPNVVELNTLVNVCREGPKVTRSSSTKLLMHVLKYMDRHVCRTRYPQFWSTASDEFDMMLCKYYFSMVRTRRKHFYMATSMFWVR